MSKEETSQVQREIAQALFMAEREQDLLTHIRALEALDNLIHCVADTSNKELINHLEPLLFSHKQLLKKEIESRFAKQGSLIHQQKMKDPVKKAAEKASRKNLIEEMIKYSKEAGSKVAAESFQKDLEALMKDEV